MGKVKGGEGSPLGSGADSLSHHLNSPSIKYKAATGLRSEGGSPIPNSTSTSKLSLQLCHVGGERARDARCALWWISRDALLASCFGLDHCIPCGEKKTKEVVLFSLEIVLLFPHIFPPPIKLTTPPFHSSHYPTFLHFPVPYIIPHNVGRLPLRC